MRLRPITLALGQALALVALGLANGCGPALVSPAKPQSIITASGVPMIVVPAGSFKMGSDDHEADESPRHEVSLSTFLMDQFEVTHDLFVKAQLPNPPPAGRTISVNRSSACAGARPSFIATNAR